MPVSITIEPFTPSIDMYDSPATSSAYSLSGHITIAASSSSILGLSRSSAHNLILSSLELTFEGQSELLLTDVGYVPLRIISITKQLVSPSHSVQITADEDRAEWRVVFNLAIPGWLPATSIFGEEDERDVAGISYALYAHARFHPAGADIDNAPTAPSTSTSSMWNNLCSVVRLGAGRPKVIQAEKVPIHVTRYVSPPTRADSAEDASPPAFPRSTFAVQALSECVPGEIPSTNIPAEILRSVELHTIVPSRTSVEDDSVPLLLRLRCRSDNEEAQRRLRVLGFEVNILQVEEFHTSPSPSYTSRFPIPPSAQQPPNKPLRSTHPVGTLFDLGLISPPPQGRQVVNEHSIVPYGASKHFIVRGTDEDSGNGGVLMDDEWLRMDVDVPVLPGLQEGHNKGKGKRVAGTSPFLDVKHEMRVRLTVGYDQPSGREGEMTMVSDELAFMVPLEFVLVTPSAVSPLASAFFPVLAHMHQHSTSSLPLPHPPMTPSHSPTHSLSRTLSLSSLSSTDASCSSTPFPPPLPAYSQLFHENGDRREDIQTALPLYREKEEEDVHSKSHTSSPTPQPPCRTLSTSSSSTWSSSSLSSSTVSSLEHVGASGMFIAPMDVSAPPPPRLGHLASPPGSPKSPRTPLTPPGLGECRLPAPGPAPMQGKRQGRSRNKGGNEGKAKGKKRENFFGESFLRFDEDDEGRERNLVHDHGYGHEVVADEHVFEEGDLDSVLGEVQYGIAL